MTAGGDPETLRRSVRTWLAANVPAGWRAAMTGTSQESFVDAQRDWFSKLVQAGFATPHWPEGWPGGGRSLAEQKVIFEEVARADAPRLILYFVALYHAACTLMERGSPGQKDAYLPKILEGEIWCQGFSEPNAGSDLASVRTRAERRGDRYVVNGQKIWSTMAQYADRCLLLTRTGKSDPPQGGLTYLLLDMRTKGVTVRPIRQITGDDEFAEIFFDDAEIPVHDRVGEEGDGWAVAQATLSAERGLTLVELSQRLRYALPRIGTAMRDSECLDDPTMRGEFGRLTAKVNALCALADQYLLRRIAGEEAPGDASIVKLYYSRVLRDFTSLGLRIGGLAAQYDQGFMRGATQETGNWIVDFMNSYNWSIAGGSDEIQRNIIAERLLRMPREPRAWQVPSERP
jgi:alkylation response protein AidB-like acyl-CoA dehydrogenase